MNGTDAPARLGRLAPIAALVVLGLVAAGCGSTPWDSDQLDRLDRVSLGAGDAQARNMTIQSVDAIPDGTPDPAPAYDGRRTRAVMDMYYGLGSGGAGASGGEAAAAAGGGASVAGTASGSGGGS